MNGKNETTYRERKREILEIERQKLERETIEHEHLERECIHIEYKCHKKAECIA